MQRFTSKSSDGQYSVDGENLEAAIQRLGRLEDAYTDLLISQKQIPTDLEKLRQQGKQKTVQYKELLIRKLNNQNILMFLIECGL